ncbi:DUF6491 family protein [Thalassomonas sp. M1454]|uniref:DUF6491 family protein n=1 Tax=Thalassomonas sp. M1454 TaxID=2594477 RepID=UPI00117F0BC1|nr:DUF6491 family protein [Thalassomonas sp. M1454]TRX53955.1 hypothetical protein FNN08_13465 [Thalassomonas sp. M1454]
MLKLLSLFSLLLLSACATNTADQAPQKPDPRQGEEVTQICFNRTMDSWSPIEGENKALVVFDRRKEQYKLDLIGTCDPDFAMLRIATISRGASNCLSKGDKVITDADMDRHDNCTIMGIYKWHPEKAEKPAEDKSTEKDESADSNK